MIDRLRGKAILAGLPDGPVLELCAGAGQIGLVVAAETGRDLVQVDTGEVACGYARRNAATAGLRTDVRCQDLRVALAPGERFPLVLADPPYATPVAEVRGVLAALVAGEWLADGAVVVVERSSREEPWEWPTPLVLLWERRYGEASLRYGRFP